MSMIQETIGVFHEEGNRRTYYTCCCRVKITQYETFCPNCKKYVIAPTLREDFTYGEEYRALKGRWLAKYIESGRMQAGMVAAKLQGTVFAMPALCMSCGEPDRECRCYSKNW